MVVSVEREFRQDHRADHRSQPFNGRLRRVTTVRRTAKAPAGRTGEWVQPTTILALCAWLGAVGVLASCSPDRSIPSAGGESATSTTLPTIELDDATSAGAPVVACDLLSIADIEATGLSVVAIAGTDPNTPGDECRYVLPNAPNSVIAGGVEVELIPAESGSFFQPLGSRDEIAIEGIGVQAWGSQGFAAARLADGRVVLLGVGGLGLVDPWPFALDLLSTAVATATDLGR
jgi:hypothetical protein